MRWRSFAVRPAEAVLAASADRPGGHATGTRVAGVFIIAALPAAAWWLRDVLSTVAPSAALLWAVLPYVLSVAGAYVLCRRATFMAHKSWHPLRIAGGIPGAMVTWGLPLTLALAVLVFTADELIVIYATYAYAVAMTIIAGFRGRRRARRIAAATELVAAALSLPASSLERRVKLRRGGTIEVRPTARAKAVAADPDQLDHMLSLLYGHEAHVDKSGKITLTPNPSYETRERRNLLAESNGLVSGARTLSATDTELELAPGTSPARAAEVNAFCVRYLAGAELVEWDPFNRRAVSRILSDRVRQVRTRLADLLHSEPWRIGDVSVTEAADEDRIDTVTIHGAPSQSPDPARRIELWKQLALTLPGGSNGWSAVEQEDTGDVTLTWGPPRSLPKIVSGRELLPTRIDPDAWSKLAFGRTEMGTVAEIDLKASPHALLVGSSGSGKSYAVRMLILAAFSRGFEVVAIDPSKKFAGLRDIDPYMKIVATDSKEQAADVLTEVYAEVQRRVTLTEEHRVEGWRQLPKSLGIKPWFVVVDEYAGLLAEKVSKPFDLKSADGDAWRAEQEAISTIRGRMSALAAEARSAGVHLCVVTQTAYADLLSGAMRQNLGAVLQLVSPKKPTQKAQLGLVFTAEDVEDAADAIAALNDGASPGFCVAAVDGARIAGVRVGLIRNERPDPDDPTPGPTIREDVDYLEELGVPAGVPLVLPNATPTQQRPVFGRVIPDDEDEVVEHAPLDGLAGAFAGGDDSFNNLFD